MGLTLQREETQLAVNEALQMQELAIDTPQVVQNLAGCIFKQLSSPVVECYSQHFCIRLYYTTLAFSHSLHFRRFSVVVPESKISLE